MKSTSDMTEHVESNLEYGTNITMTIDLIRHAEKDKEGQLTEKWKKDSVEFGNILKENNPDSSGTIVYISDVDRAQGTGEWIGWVDTKLKKRTTNVLSLTWQISKRVSDNLKMLIDTETGDESAAIQAIVDSNDTRIDPETISSQEISQRIANKILELINISERFKTNSKVNVVMVSHSGVIENFIVDILKEERKHFIKKIWGQLNFLEGVKLIINRKDKNNVEIQLSFRDYNLNITKEDLENIANWWKQ